MMIDNYIIIEHNTRDNFIFYVRKVSLMYLNE